MARDGALGFAIFCIFVGAVSLAGCRSDRGPSSAMLPAAARSVDLVVHHLEGPQDHVAPHVEEHVERALALGRVEAQPERVG